MELAKESTRCRMIFSGVGSYRKRLEERGIRNFGELVNFWDMHKRPKCFEEINDLQTRRGLLFIDSGAWSAFNSGKEINMDTFIKWHKDLERECPQLYFKAGLDVIGNYKGSMENQQRTDDAGLRLFPTFHRGDPDDYLRWMLGRAYSFWGLGGVASGALTESDKIAEFLDVAFSAICDEQGKPKINCHLFGVSNVELIHRYPGWSNDSTSALFTATYGSIWVPQLDPHSHEIDWSRPMIHLTVSAESNARAKANTHYLTLKGDQQEVVRQLLAKHDFTIEQVMTSNEDRQCFCHVMLMEQAANYPEDVRFKAPTKEYSLFD